MVNSGRWRSSLGAGILGRLRGHPGNSRRKKTAARPTEDTLVDADIYLKKETGKVLERFVKLVVLSAAELAIGHWYKKRRKEHEQLRKPNRHAQGRRFESRQSKKY